MSHFIIITNPRSGSTWFADKLNNVKDITCHDELLVKTRYQFSKSYLKSEEYLAKVQTHPHWEYFKKRHNISSLNIISFFKYFDSNLSLSLCGGFKLMFKQIFRHPLILPYILIRRVRFIRLKRKNLLNIILSWEAMKYRERGHNIKPVKQVCVYLDPQETLKEIKKLDFWDKVTNVFCQIMPVPVHYVVYEDIIGSEKKWQAIVEFIAGDYLEDSAASSKYTKSNTSKHKDMIENYAEIKNLLQNTKYKDFIE